MGVGLGDTRVKLATVKIAKYCLIEDELVSNCSVKIFVKVWRIDLLNNISDFCVGTMTKVKIYFSLSSLL